MSSFCLLLQEVLFSKGNLDPICRMLVLNKAWILFACTSLWHWSQLCSMGVLVNTSTNSIPLALLMVLHMGAMVATMVAVHRTWNCLCSHPENYSRQWLDGKNVLRMWGNRFLMCWLGSRFGFKLEEELKNTGSCEQVKEALATKLSHGCIGHEVINFLPVYEPLTNLTIGILPMCMTVKRCLFLNHLIVS
jgi:hypothetical protein